MPWASSVRDTDEVRQFMILCSRGFICGQPATNLDAELALSTLHAQESGFLKSEDGFDAQKLQIPEGLKRVDPFAARW